MSVLIKDMEIPKGCVFCELTKMCPVWKHKWIPMEKLIWYMENRDVNCPMEEVEDGEIH